MKQFYLAEITTKDKLIHQGIFFRPKKPSKRAILWVHGLTDNFYGDLALMEELSTHCDKEGWGLASFNMRGHDIVASVKKLDPTSPKGQTGLTNGAAYERFEDSRLDIDAGISFLVDQGFSEIIIAGISSGANKVCFYAGSKRDPRVSGVLLASPISDVAIKKKELGSKFKATLAKVAQLVRQKNGNKLYDDYDYMPLTPTRYLSLYTPESTEDVFQYYHSKPDTWVLSRTKKPLMVLMGDRDEYADRPVPEIIKFFERYNRSTRFSRSAITGAFHSYGGKEREAAKAIVNWIRTI